MKIRRLLNRLRHPKGRYSYSCYECGHRIYDDPGDYLDEATRDTEFGFPNSSMELNPESSAVLTDGETVHFTWEADLT